jgi:hypothetical protein
MMLKEMSVKHMEGSDLRPNDVEGDVGEEFRRRDRTRVPPNL